MQLLAAHLNAEGPDLDQLEEAVEDIQADQEAAVVGGAHGNAQRIQRACSSEALACSLRATACQATGENSSRAAAGEAVSSCLL